MSDAATIGACPICIENEGNQLIHLTTCSHWGCNKCLKTWIEQIEATGTEGPPPCPFCRQPFTTDDVYRILGRSFHPAEKIKEQDPLGNGNNTVDDDLTQDWLLEFTKQCPRCRAHIMKEEDTCDLMECLCGFRFCFSCGAANAQCCCNPETHGYYDNVLQTPVFDRGRANNEVAPIDDETGEVRLAAFIAQKRKREEGGRTRNIREQRREDEEYEKDYLEFMFYTRFQNMCIFLPTRISTLRMLDEIFCASPSPMSKMMKKLDLEDEEEPEGYLHYSNYMFKCRTRSESIMILAKGEKAELRQYVKNCNNNLKTSRFEEFVAYGSWMFDAAFNGTRNKKSQTTKGQTKAIKKLWHRIQRLHENEYDPQWNTMLTFSGSQSSALSLTEKDNRVAIQRVFPEKEDEAELQRQRFERKDKREKEECERKELDQNYFTRFQNISIFLPSKTSSLRMMNEILNASPSPMSKMLARYALKQDLH